MSNDALRTFDFRSSLTADIEAIANLNPLQADALKFLRSVEVVQAEVTEFNGRGYEQKTLVRNAAVINHMRVLIDTGNTSIISGLAILERAYGEDTDYKLLDTGLDMTGHTSLEGRKWLVFTALVARFYDSRQTRAT